MGAAYGVYALGMGLRAQSGVPVRSEKNEVAYVKPSFPPVIFDKEGRRLKTKHWWRVTYFPPRGFDAKVWIIETRPMHVNGWVRFRISIKGDKEGGAVNVFRPLIEPVPIGTKPPPKRFVPTGLPPELIHMPDMENCS